MKLEVKFEIHCSSRDAEAFEDTVNENMPAVEIYRTAKQYSKPPKFSYKVICEDPSLLVMVGAAIENKISDYKLKLL